MRRIVSVVEKSRGGVPAATADGYFDRILKFIPTEIVAGWIALSGLTAELDVRALWVLFAVIAVLSYFWMIRQTRDEGKPPAVLQSMIAVVSFMVWAFAMKSGPFLRVDYPAEYGSIALIVYTLIIGLVIPKA